MFLASGKPLKEVDDSCERYLYKFEITSSQDILEKREVINILDNQLIEREAKIKRQL